MSTHAARSSDPRVEDHFQDAATQIHAGRLGMWVFIASEALMFSGLFALYAARRAASPDVFAEASRHADLWIGSANTLVLLTSSLLVAMAIHSIRDTRFRSTRTCLFAAAGLGALFLALKAWEYARHFAEGIRPGPAYSFAELSGPDVIAFFNLYYIMTGLHGLHVLIGVCLLALLARQAGRGRYDAVHHAPVELGGMYWHFVDVVWLFLWPAFYLLRGS